SSLLAVLAQRLVRRLCEHCKTEVEPSPRERELLGDASRATARIFKAGGCDHCDFTGYRGRLGIFELVRVDENMKRMIHDNAGEADIIAAARRQSRSLLDDGMGKVAAGITTFDEVFRVTQDGA